MLIACASSLAVLALSGSLMSNYAYRELQWEELRTAVRAAISSAAPLLAGAGNPTVDAEIRRRVSAFAQGTTAGVSMDSTDVTVTHDSGTGVTTIGTGGTFAFQNLWGGSSSSDTAEAISETVGVKIEVDRHEVAVAADISGSMRNSLSAGVTRMDGLKAAMGTIANVMQTTSTATPGSLLVSLVPFTTAVNVADTGGTGQTAAKERYLRMLAGAPGDSGTVADTLTAAQSAVNAGWGQWVDTFHYYGVGNDLGPLRTLGLPQDLLDDTDWNLRRTGVTLDVSNQVPALGNWVVDDEDFWNGCVMARWGAYWNADVRPSGWVADDSANWPAAKTVPGWSAGAAALPATTPLHLSDAPPDADNAHTLFTAYSWPDSRIGGQMDHHLQAIMAWLLDPRMNKEGLRIRPNWMLRDFLDEIPGQADLDWSGTAGQGGATLCPSNPILPLTEDVAVLRQVVNSLQAQSGYFPAGYFSVAGTYLNLGIVWGLRTLSPLWQQVWQVNDVQGVARPAVPCAPGEADGDCNPLLHKSILIITDGTNFPSAPLPSRLHYKEPADPNPTWQANDVCGRAHSYLGPYFTAVKKDDETEFNNLFSAYLDDGHFGGAQLNRVLNAYSLLVGGSNTPTERALRRLALQSLTPWQIFRGLDADGIDALMNPANQFGFDRRPVQAEHLCRPSSMFGPYGRVDDRVLVGETSTVPATQVAPVADVAPFTLAGWPTATVGDGTPGTGYFGENRALFHEMTDRLDGWFVESCRIAGERRVRVNAIYIGNPNGRGSAGHIGLLERCVDAAGGAPNHPDVLVTPDAETLNDAFGQLFTVRRNLRFL